MTTTSIEFLDPEEIQEERSAILADLGMSREELDRLASDYRLGPMERTALRKLEILEYLAS